MKVYRPGTKGLHRLFVQPGKKIEKSEWQDAYGNPIMYTVEFREGVAHVETQLGRYLIDEGLAARSPIIVPPLERKIALPS